MEHSVTLTGSVGHMVLLLQQSSDQTLRGRDWTGVVGVNSLKPITVLVTREGSPPHPARGWKQRPSHYSSDLWTRSFGPLEQNNMVV